MNKEIAIHIEGLSKKYSIGKQKDGSLRGSLGRLFSQKSTHLQDFWALKDVSFDIQKGDVVGIIGKNGAGKSTLLKILSQITKPTKGHIEIHGRVASLLEVGTGFHPELTGRENVYLNGTILGMTRKEVKSKFDEIVAFSGVEKFIDTPVKHYSSGMYVRLAFAVAAHLEPEILIIDEVLAVGDAEFQKKCLGKMQDVANNGRTVLFVSHNMSSVASLCNKGILLEQGTIISNETVVNAIQKYQANQKTNSTYFKEFSNAPSYIKEISFVNGSNIFRSDESIFIKTISVYDENFMGNLLIRILDTNSNVISSFETKNIKNKTEICLKIQKESLLKGVYYLSAILYQPAIIRYDIVEECCQFEVIDNIESFMHMESFNIGSTYIKHEWY